MLNYKNILWIGGDILKKFINQNKHKKVLTTKREVLFYAYTNDGY